MPVPGITRLRELLGPPIARLERSVTRFVVREMPTFCYLARQLGAWWEARRRPPPRKGSAPPRRRPHSPYAPSRRPRTDELDLEDIWREPPPSRAPTDWPGPRPHPRKPPPQGPPTC